MSPPVVSFASWPVLLFSSRPWTSRPCFSRAIDRIGSSTVASMPRCPGSTNLFQRASLGFGQILHAPQEREHADHCVEPENARGAAQSPFRQVLDCRESK